MSYETQWRNMLGAAQQRTTGETDAYARFLARKAIQHAPTGIADPPPLNRRLAPFQQDGTRFALQRGRAALFEECGLGKTWQGLEWSAKVVQHTHQPVLILTPLAVAGQWVREGQKLWGEDWGPVPIHVREASDLLGDSPVTYVTNYERLDKLEELLPRLGGVVLDECFAAGTLVDTPNGARAIETMRAGDEILNAVGVDVVSDVHRREVEFCVRVRAGADSCVCSPNHPFFTQRGWVGAQDLQAGDYLLGSAEALRLVRESILPEAPFAESAEVLRNILLSEVADDAAGDPCGCALTGGERTSRSSQSGVVSSWISDSGEGARAHTRAEPDERPRLSREVLPPIESDGARTFRAWGKRSWFDAASTDHAGCSWIELGSGVCLVVGPTQGGLSNALQARLGPGREENRRRGGWQLPLQPPSPRREEGRDAGFVRLDGVEVLEPGHPDVERLRAADGKLYLYDLGATRHPSYSVNGWLVHNSSILKAYDGKTRTRLIEAFQPVPFRLALTATPSPNDVTELGNHAEFLGAMSRVEMLATFFCHDGGDTSVWRLKGHAERDFWAWVRTWAMCVSKPSDLGYSDDGYELPPLELVEHVIDVDARMARQAGLLFAFEASTLADQREVRRATLDERVAAVAKLVNETPGQWLVFCDLNAESEALTAAIAGAVEITGSMKDDQKERAILDFAEGRIERVVSKTSIIGFGCNLQGCHQIAYAGSDHSYERFHQSVRRCWRFGQRHPVRAHLFRTSADGRVAHNLERKRLEHEAMVRSLVASTAIGAERKRITGGTQALKLPAFLRKEPTCQ